MRRGAIILLVFLLGFQNNRQSTELWPLPDLYYFPPLPKGFKTPRIVEVQLGRRLFYDPILSADGSLSCASCHQQASAFSGGGMQFNLGIEGFPQKRNTPGLFNLAWLEQFFWDGRAKTLEEQALVPVRDPHEMNLDWPKAVERLKGDSYYGPQFASVYPRQKLDSNLVVLALAQFERILFSQDSKYDRVLRGEDYFSPLEYRGYTLVNLQNKGDCLHCHITDAHALGTHGKLSNNGLEAANQAGDYADAGAGAQLGPEKQGWFKVPSLRNLGFTAPYMHDGRFATLREVLEFYRSGVQQPYNADSKMQFAHQGGVALTDEELEAILAFLATLNDSLFVQNPAYANPFE